MNFYSTTKKFSSLNMKLLQLIIFMTIAFSYYTCAAPAQENLQNAPDSTKTANQGEKTFIFHKMAEGKDNLWKVVFEDGKIVELYKNGKEIPKEDIGDYQSMVEDELAELNPDHFVFPPRHFHFWIDRSALDSSLKHLSESLSHKDFGWVDSAFNSKEFRVQMDSLRKNLQGLKKMKFDFHFDTSAFNKSMRELKKNLEHMKFNRHDFQCDMGAFKEEMRKFREEMKRNRFNSDDFKIDMREFENDMRKFGEEMKHFGMNMKKFDKEMKSYHSFMTDLRHELVNDKLIKNEDEEFDMKFNSKEMIINGKIVPDNLFKKYKKLYKEHFGKDINHEMDIN